VAADVGGTVDSFHFGFGATDADVIVDVPDNVTAAGIAMLVSASGMASCKTTVLLTPEEVDRAGQVHATYRPPGS
jgi:uncharacterized protein with GYD domain